MEVLLCKTQIQKQMVMREIRETKKGRNNDN